MSEHNRSARLPVAIAAGILSYLVAAVFFPILGFQFVNYDVKASVVDNPYIRGFTAENIKHILTAPCIESYYPVRTLTYVLDYSIWGLHPRGFKLTNCLLHLVNVLLLWGLIRRLIRVSSLPEEPHHSWREMLVLTLVCGVFAIHPVVVEPVTWVAGREELLMTLGALACLHFHLSARQLAARGGRSATVISRHVLATVCCLLACLSNVVGIVIPALITAWDWLTLPPPKLGKTLRASLALWVIAAAALVSKLSQWGFEPDPSGQEMVPFSPLRQLRLALEVYWLNFKSLIWPTRLAVRYDCRTFPDDFFDREVVLGILAVALTCFLLWSLRQKKLILYGILWFLITWAPASQLMPHHIHRADRFLYLPLAGLAIALATGILPWIEKLKSRAGMAAAGAVGVGILFVLDLVSARQVQTWRNSITMWENCVKVTPDDAYLQNLLAECLVEQGEWQRAERVAERALALDFAGNAKALCSRVMILTAAPGANLADCVEALRLANRACELTNWKDQECRHALALAHTSLADAQAASGQFAPALKNYRNAIEQDDKYDLALLNLALLLATCDDEKLRNPDEAVLLAERACKTIQNPSPDVLRVLAEAYYAAGRVEQAKTTAQRVIRIAQEAGDTAILEGVRRWIETHQ